MVRIFNRGPKPDPEGDTARAILADNAAPPQPGTMDEFYMRSLAERAYMILDDTPQFIAGSIDKGTGRPDGPLSHLAPAFSHLHRLGKLNAKQARIERMKLGSLLILTGMTIPKQETDAGRTPCALRALEIHGDMMFYDSIDGFKAKVVTEQTKHVGVVMQKQKGILR